MSWTTPKTDWKADDYINASDFNRWVNNIKYLKDLSQILFEAMELEAVDGNKNYNSDVYASEINAIEHNLDLINRRTYNADIGEMQTYYPNGETIDYNEINRIEKASLKLFNTMYGQLSIRPHLAVVLTRKSLGKRTKYDHNEIIAQRCDWRLSEDRRIRV